jgi:actin-related protein 3
MFKDFNRRLEKDIKKLTSSRLQLSSMMASASLHESVSSKEIEVNVVQHKRQRYAVWFGGSLLADTVSGFIYVIYEC